MARYQAQYRNAARLYERTRTLSAQHLVAEAQVDSTRAERDMAQGLIQQTQALIAQKPFMPPLMASSVSGKFMRVNTLALGKPLLAWWIRKL